MGRKRLSEEYRKEKITIRLKKGLIERLKEINNYNSYIEKILEENLKKKK